MQHNTLKFSSAPFLLRAFARSHLGEWLHMTCNTFSHHHVRQHSSTIDKIAFWKNTEPKTEVKAKCWIRRPYRKRNHFIFLTGDFQ